MTLWIAAGVLAVIAVLSAMTIALVRAPKLDPDDQAGWSDDQQAEWRMMRHGAPPSTFTEAE